jgi:hypothetical protein
MVVSRMLLRSSKKRYGVQAAKMAGSVGGGGAPDPAAALHGAGGSSLISTTEDNTVDRLAETAYEAFIVRQSASPCGARQLVSSASAVDIHGTGTQAGGRAIHGPTSQSALSTNGSTTWECPFTTRTRILGPDHCRKRAGQGLVRHKLTIIPESIASGE